MLYATISADIVDSTKMTAEDTIRMNKLLTDFLEPMMKVSEGSWGRSEYVVAGTFISFCIALALGLLVVKMG